MAVTASGFKNRILEEAPTLGITVNPNQAMKIALRVARRIDSMNEDLDFYEALRVLGIISDPTARNAVHFQSCRKAECDTCGRTKRAKQVAA